MTARHVTTRWALVVAGSALSLVACGDDATATFAAGGAWARPTPGQATNGVVYLEVSSDVDDVLSSVEVSPDVAYAAELHATTIGGEAGGHVHGGGGGDDDTVSMTTLDDIPIGKGETVTFEPGGNHVMLTDLVEPLVDGGHFTLTLRFASGRTLTTDVVVADNPPD